MQSPQGSPAKSPTYGGGALHGYLDHGSHQLEEADFIESPLGQHCSTHIALRELPHLCNWKDYSLNSSGEPLFTYKQNDFYEDRFKHINGDGSFYASANDGLTDTCATGTAFAASSEVFKFAEHHLGYSLVKDGEPAATIHPHGACGPYSAVDLTKDGHSASFGYVEWESRLREHCYSSMAWSRQIVAHAAGILLLQKLHPALNALMLHDETEAFRDFFGCQIAFYMFLQEDPRALLRDTEGRFWDPATLVKMKQQWELPLKAASFAPKHASVFQDVPSSFTQDSVIFHRHSPVAFFLQSYASRMHVGQVPPTLPQHPASILGTTRHPHHLSGVLSNASYALFCLIFNEWLVQDSRISSEQALMEAMDAHAKLLFFSVHCLSGPFVSFLTWSEALLQADSLFFSRKFRALIIRAVTETLGLPADWHQSLPQPVTSAGGVLLSIPAVVPVVTDGGAEGHPDFVEVADLHLWVSRHAAMLHVPTSCSWKEQGRQRLSETHFLVWGLCEPLQNMWKFIFRSEPTSNCWQLVHVAAGLNSKAMAVSASIASIASHLQLLSGAESRGHALLSAARSHVLVPLPCAPWHLAQDAPELSPLRRGRRKEEEEKKGDDNDNDEEACASPSLFSAASPCKANNLSADGASPAQLRADRHVQSALAMNPRHVIFSSGLCQAALLSYVLEECGNVPCVTALLDQDNYRWYRWPSLHLYFWEMQIPSDGKTEWYGSGC
jgi:hypothetical protein